MIIFNTAVIDNRAGTISIHKGKYMLSTYMYLQIPLRRGSEPAMNDPRYRDGSNFHSIIVSKMHLLVRLDSRFLFHPGPVQRTLALVGAPHTGHGGGARRRDRVQQGVDGARAAPTKAHGGDRLIVPLCAVRTQ